MAQTLRINGKSVVVTSEDETPLLYVLTDELAMKGPRFGCGLAQCGSCSVLVDGAEVRSCVMPMAQVVGREITTLEGLPGFYAKKAGLAKAPDLHPVQQAFVDNQSSQCGYCYNGMAVKAAELLALKAEPTESDIRRHMAGHICRCGTYQRILEAILAAAKTMRNHS